MYHRAVVEFFGGEEAVVREIPIIGTGGTGATQKIHLLNGDTAFKITAVGEGAEMVEDHLRRFLSHTPLQAIQWLNLNKHTVSFVTLINDAPYSCR